MSDTIVNNDDEVYNPESREAYLKELGQLQLGRREQIQEINNQTTELVMLLQDIHGQKSRPEARVTDNELYVLIGMVLDTGVTGTKAIRIYAKEHGKDKQWCKDIAKPKAGKFFDSALSDYQDHLIIEGMIKSNCYCKRDILKCSITGALNKLSKQRLHYMELVKKNKHIAQLNERLALKEEFSNKPFDKNEAQILRDSGLKLREIAAIMGVGKSIVGKYTKSKA